MCPNQMKQKTAFLVIHGSGYHPPFATLDKFVRGFREYLKRHSGQNFDKCWRHELVRHASINGRADWAENYITLEIKDKPIIDFYEYYWDCYMDHEISFADAINWLSKASNGAKQFYADPKNSERWETDDDAKAANFLRTLGLFGFALKMARLLSKMNIKIVSTVAGAIVALISGPLQRSMQDVTIYCSTYTRAKNYQIRQEVLQGAVNQIQLLRDMEYDIIVVGHSLGSVIAYDALNRLIVEMSAGKPKTAINQKDDRPENVLPVRGLVTFGSVLDKVAFFFREHMADEEYVRRQITNHFHIFGRIVRCPLCHEECAEEFPNEKELTNHIHNKHMTYKCPQCHILVNQGNNVCPNCKTVLKDPVRIDNPVHNFLDQITWLNFHHPDDHYAGRIDAYKDVANHACNRKLSRWKTPLGKRDLKRGLVSILTFRTSEAHEHYWDCDFMYDEIVDTFFPTLVT